MPGKVRRIVTGVNAAGRSYIVSDTLLPTAAVAPGAPVLHEPVPLPGAAEPRTRNSV